MYVRPGNYLGVPRNLSLENKIKDLALKIEGWSLQNLNFLFPVPSADRIGEPLLNGLS